MQKISTEFLNTLFLFCLKTNSIEFFRTCLYHYCRYVCTYVWAHVYTKFENFTRHKCIILWGIYTIYVKTFLYTFEYISIYLQLHHIFLVCKTFRQKPSKMILKCAWHIILNLHTLTHLRTNFVLVDVVFIIEVIFIFLGWLDFWGCVFLYTIFPLIVQNIVESSQKW